MAASPNETRLQETIMSGDSPRKPHDPNEDIPDEIEPDDALPLAPEGGLISDHIPQDPEHDRVIEPED
jgi:hypothetical protein